tara:strand:- start:99 stop:1913 length:1815 start_codon:yes stop_codon:yes gene_type:complete
MNIQSLAKEINVKIMNIFFPQKKENEYDLDIYSNFHLPISYLEKDVHTIEPTLCNDLELTPSTKNIENTETKSIYEYFLKPENEFALNILEKWKTNYTSNKEFIKDSQQLILRMELYKQSTDQTYKTDCDKLKTIWKNIKCDDCFLQKYNYIEWDAFMYLNKQPRFLLGLSTLQIMSPIVGLLLPIILLIFPFVLLKIQNVPINLYQYIKILKSIAKNHFLGVAIKSFEDFSIVNFAYLAISLGFFVFQMYQNIRTCQTFYENIKEINNNIIFLKTYLQNSVTKMGEFLSLTKDLNSYKPFCAEVSKHLESILAMQKEINNITPFTINITKFTCIGELLKSYYILFENINYADALKYSMSFEGYINNLYGIHDNLTLKNVGIGNTDNNKKSNFTNQYYPAILDEEPIKNNCNLKENVIISSPNKSGKTTFLKTTLINIILTQQTGIGYYDSCEINPYTDLHCYLNIPDTSGRDSLFQAESRRCKEILDKIAKKTDERHFCIFDELYSGTNPEEATKAGTAFLKYLENYKNVDFILTTHYLNVCKKFKPSKLTTNYKMDVTIKKDGTFVYHYKIKKGISKIKGATRVLKDMNYPDEIIKSIENYN